MHISLVTQFKLSCVVVIFNKKTITAPSSNGTKTILPSLHHLENVKNWLELREWSIIYRHGHMSDVIFHLVMIKLKPNNIFITFKCIQRLFGKLSADNDAVVIVNSVTPKAFKFIKNVFYGLDYKLSKNF